MSIRTTITLEEDVVERVKIESRRRGTTFRATLNDLLRTALATGDAPGTRPVFRVKANHMGYRPGLNYDDIAGLLEYAEGDSHR